ncbi:MAG: hypothetical protein ACFB9N_12385 [Geitlerinemataceae cyanobacterium]
MSDSFQPSQRPFPCQQRFFFFLEKLYFFFVETEPRNLFVFLERQEAVGRQAEGCASPPSEPLCRRDLNEIIAQAANPDPDGNCSLRFFEAEPTKASDVEAAKN